MGNVVPRGLPHSTFIKDHQIGKYVIPKGHTINASFNQILKSERYWDEPMTFKPERFLNKVRKRAIPSHLNYV